MPSAKGYDPGAHLSFGDGMQVTSCGSSQHQGL